MKEIKGNGSIKLDLISKQWVVSSYWELALIIYAPLAYHYEPISKNICKYIYLWGISLSRPFDFLSAHNCIRNSLSYTV